MSGMLSIPAIKRERNISLVFITREFNTTVKSRHDFDFSVSVHPKGAKQKWLTHCAYLLYTVVTVAPEPKSWWIGPISPAAGGTLYQQIVDRLKREISEGRLEPGAALPSFRQLAEDLLVSVITVKRAYEELERDGIIFRRQGLGTFVAERGHDRSRETKLADAKELLRQGFREATEAGLNAAELSELARLILHEKD